MKILYFFLIFGLVLGCSSLSVKDKNSNRVIAACAEVGGGMSKDFTDQFSAAIGKQLTLSEEMPLYEVRVVNTADGNVIEITGELGSLNAGDLVRVTKQLEEQTIGGSSVFEINIVNSEINRRFGSIITPAEGCPPSG